MEKIIKPFTSEETEVLRGNYPKVARKHNVSSNYVSKIAEGVRDTRSIKARAILKDLKKLVKVLTTI